MSFRTWLDNIWFKCHSIEDRPQFFQQTASRDGRIVTPLINDKFFYDQGLQGMRIGNLIQPPPRLGLGNPVYLLNPMAVVPAPSNQGSVVSYSNPQPNPLPGPNRQMKVEDNTLFSGANCSTCGNKSYPVNGTYFLPSIIAPPVTSPQVTNTGSSVQGMTGNTSTNTNTATSNGGGVGSSNNATTQTNTGNSSQTGSGGAQPTSGTGSSSSGSGSGPATPSSSYYPTAGAPWYQNAQYTPVPQSSAPTPNAGLSSGSRVGMTSAGSLNVPRGF